MTNKIASSADALIRRIETTKKTDPEIFAECDTYIRAAFLLLDPEYKTSPRNRLCVLEGQMLALELAKIVPSLLTKVNKEAIDFELNSD